MAVKAALEKAGIEPLNITLGEVTVAKEPSKVKLKELSISLQHIGFELLDDQKSKLIEKVKTFIIQTIHYDNILPDLKFSVLIGQHANHDYSFISKLFSEIEGITLEQYIILQKIEKVKELMTYDELSIAQIALDLGYSSTAHLSNQFKKVTGTTPSLFKKGAVQHRQSLDDVGGKL
ncbi:MAG: AraC family transcriptional regulator [Ferruginibacter sp.]